MNLITHKAAAKHELLFSTSEVGLLNMYVGLKQRYDLGHPLVIL
jgi:hypothetical protein